jgi:hypothetical protein
MTTKDLVIFAYTIYDIEEHRDLYDLCLQKISEIDLETVEDICQHYKIIKEGDYSYLDSDMDDDIYNIYIEFKKYITDDAVSYLIRETNLSINDVENPTMSNYLAHLEKKLNNSYFDDYNPEGYSKYIKKDIYQMIPTKYRTVEFFRKLVDIKLEFFSAIYPKFTLYTELCLTLLTNDYDIFTYIPYKYVTLEMLQLYIQKSKRSVKITNYNSIITDDIIVELFSSNRIYNYDTINSVTVMPRLFEIDYDKCFTHYNPTIHGQELIPKFIEKGVYGVLKYSDYITFDMIKDIPNVFEIVMKAPNYRDIIEKSYAELIKLDNRFVSKYLYSICEYDHLFKDNLDLVILTLECDIKSFIKVAPYVTFDIVKQYIDNCKLDIRDITYLNIELQTQIAKYILETTPEKYLDLKYCDCMTTLLNEELVERILDKNIKLYENIPTDFKNRENSIKYLESPKAFSFYVPNEILELIGGKSACKMSK